MEEMLMTSKYNKYLVILKQQKRIMIFCSEMQLN
jgi:hypothetical protein